MHVKRITPILNVTSVPDSIQWFEQLGWQRTFTWNAAGIIAKAELHDEAGPAVFAGVCSPNTSKNDDDNGPEIFLCRDGQGARDPDTEPHPDREDYGGVWMSWWVDDVDAAHAICVERDVRIIRPPINEPWGVREFLIGHPDGHYFRISGPVT